MAIGAGVSAHTERHCAAISYLTARALRRWPWFLVGAAVVAGAGLWLASHLQVRSGFEELLPDDVPSVRELKELARRVGGDGTILVVIESLDGYAGLPRAEARAMRLVQELRALQPDLIRSIDFDVRPAERSAWSLTPRRSRRDPRPCLARAA